MPLNNEFGNFKDNKVVRINGYLNTFSTTVHLFSSIQVSNTNKEYHSFQVANSDLLNDYCLSVPDYTESHTNCFEIMWFCSICTISAVLCSRQVDITISTFQTNPIKQFLLIAIATNININTRKRFITSALRTC